MHMHTHTVFNTVQELTQLNMEKCCFNTNTAVSVRAAEIRFKYATISKHRDSLMILIIDSNDPPKVTKGR